MDFISDIGADGLYRIAQHVNARLRGQMPWELRKDESEKGASLPMLHTPSVEDKPGAFKRGYDAIREYVESSEDSIDKKIEGVAMAAEALVIWVHPFNDGNGRTSRFIGKFLEDGASDVNKLVAETVSNRNRPMIYDNKLRSREGLLADANNDDLMLDDDERDAMRERALRLPNDVDVIYLSIKRLLEDDAVRLDSNRLRNKLQQAA